MFAAVKLDSKLEKEVNAAIKADKKQAVAAKLLKTVQENVAQQLSESAAQSERGKGRLIGDVCPAQNMQCECCVRLIVF